MPSSVPVGGMRMSVSTTSGVLSAASSSELVIGAALTDQLEVAGGVDQPREAVTEQHVVLRHQHPDHGGSVTGRGDGQPGCRRRNAEWTYVPASSATTGANASTSSAPTIT